MQENMRLFRSKRGLDTFFDSREDLTNQLRDYLEIQEMNRQLDVDFCPMWKKPEAQWGHIERFLIKKLFRYQRPYNRHGSPFKMWKDYERLQRDGWGKQYDLIQSFISRRDLFPTRRGKVFNGFPVHFSTADKEQIRVLLQDLKEYTRFLEDGQEGILFTIECLVKSMLGGILSVWLYIGMQAPVAEAEAEM